MKKNFDYFKYFTHIAEKHCHIERCFSVYYLKVFIFEFNAASLSLHAELVPMEVTCR